MNSACMNKQAKSEQQDFVAAYVSVVFQLIEIAPMTGALAAFVRLLRDRSLELRSRSALTTWASGRTARRHSMPKGCPRAQGMFIRREM